MSKELSVPTNYRENSEEGKREKEKSIRGFDRLVQVTELQDTRKSPLDVLNKSKSLLRTMFHAKEPFLMGATRYEPNGDVEYVVTDTSLRASSNKEDSRTLLLPPGAKGKPVDPEKMREKLSGFTTWTRLNGEQHLTNQSQPGEADFLGNDLLRDYKKPVSLWVYGLPVTLETIKDRAELFLDEASKYEKSTNPRQQRIREKSNRMYEELYGADLAGYWNIAILGGVKDPDDLPGVGGNLSIAANSSVSTYIFRPHKTAESFEKIINDPELMEGSTDLLATLATPPMEELQGIPKKRRPTHSVNLEKRSQEIPEERKVVFGKRLDPDGNTLGDFEMDTRDFLEHTLVVGRPGRGKSETIFSILSGLSEKRRSDGEKITFTVFAPSGGDDYRRLGAILEGVDPASKVAYYPLGQPSADGITVGINPMKPPEGVSLKAHIPKLLGIFNNAFEGDAEGSGLYATYIEGALVEPGNVYEKGGIKRDGSAKHKKGSVRWPTIADTFERAKELVDNVGYSEQGEARGNIKGFMERVGMSVKNGRSGEFFQGEPMDVGKLCKSDTIIDTDGIDSAADQTLIIGSTILQMSEHIVEQDKKREIGGPNELKHMIIIEEAHRLFAKDSPSQDTVKAFANLILEMRKYGVGIVIADQSPDLLHPSILETGTKIIHTLQATANRTVVGEAIGMSPESIKDINDLDRGVAFVRTPNATDHLRVQMPDPSTRPNRKDRVVGPEVLLKDPNPEMIFTDSEKDDAKDLLGTKEGSLLTDWARLQVVNTLTGGTPISPDFNPETNGGTTDFLKLQEYPERVRQKALKNAVKDIVRPLLPTIGDHISNDDLEKFVEKQISSYLNNEQPENAYDIDLVLPGYKYNSLITLLETHIVETGKEHAPKHPKSAKLASYLGLTDIPGDKGNNQLEFIEGLIDENKEDHALLFKKTTTILSQVDNILVEQLKEIPPYDDPVFQLQPEASDNVLEQYVRVHQQAEGAVYQVPFEDPEGESMFALYKRLEKYIAKNIGDHDRHPDSKRLGEVFGKEIPGKNAFEQKLFLESVLDNLSIPKMVYSELSDHIRNVGQEKAPIHPETEKLKESLDIAGENGQQQLESAIALKEEEGASIGKFDLGELFAKQPVEGDINEFLVKFDMERRTRQQVYSLYSTSRISSIID